MGIIGKIKKIAPLRWWLLGLVISSIFIKLFHSLIQLPLNVLYAGFWGAEYHYQETSLRGVTVELDEGYYIITVIVHGLLGLLSVALINGFTGNGFKVILTSPKEGTNESNKSKRPLLWLGIALLISTGLFWIYDNIIGLLIRVIIGPSSLGFITGFLILVIHGFLGLLAVALINGFATGKFKVRLTSPGED